MYYPDLSPLVRAGHHVRAVGWLDAQHGFERGVFEQELFAKLARLSAKPQNKTRGYYPCPFCADSFSGGYLRGVPIELDGRTVHLGSAEIHVIGNGVVYAAPDLIVHYVDRHGYLPPREFLDAVAAVEQLQLRREEVASRGV